MKYYLLQATNFLSSKDEARALFGYNNLDEVLSAFHSTLASAMANSDVSSCLCQVISHNGQATKTEYWEREVENNSEE